MPDDDLLTRATALHERAQQVRDQAAGLRSQLNDAFQHTATELGIARDRARLAETSATQAVAAADAHTTQLEETKATYQQQLKDTEASIQQLNSGHDADGAEELQERAEGYRRMIAEADARVHASKMDAAAAREAAGSAARHAMEADVAYDEHYDAVAAAEQQLDKLDDQARLIEQARTKLVEADMMYGGDPPADADIDEWVMAKSTLEVEADDLVEQADGIEVDRRVIAVLVPSADDPPPAPVVNDTDLIDPFADDTDLEAPDTSQHDLGLDTMDVGTVQLPDTTETDDAGAENTDDGVVPDLEESDLPDERLDPDEPTTDWSQFDAVGQVADDVWSAITDAADDVLAAVDAPAADAGPDPGFDESLDDGFDDGFDDEPTDFDLA